MQRYKPYRTAWRQHRLSRSEEQIVSANFAKKKNSFTTNYNG